MVSHAGESSSTGEKSGHQPFREFSAKEKSIVVLRLLKGEEASALAAELGVSVSRLERWQSRFLAGGRAYLEIRGHQRSFSDEIRGNWQSISYWAVLILVLLLAVGVLVRFLY